MTMNMNGMNNPYTAMYAFNNLGLNTPMTGAYTGMVGMGNPFTTGVLSPQYQMNTMAQWDQFGFNRQVSNFTGNNNAQFQMSTQNDAIYRQVAILNQQIKANNKDNVMTEYNKLLQTVKDAYGSQISGDVSADVATQQVRAYAERVYSQQTGTSLIQDVADNCTGSFVQGLKKAVSLGYADKTSREELIAEITGTELTKATKAKAIAGKAVAWTFAGIAALATALVLKR